MMPPGSFSASFASASPTRRLSSSLSSTQGPAIRKSLSAGKSSATLFRRFYGRALTADSDWRFRLHSRTDEACEERMRTCGARLKLGVELAANEPWMRLQLHHLDQRSVRRKTTEVESVLDELIAVFVIDLIAMPMALADLWRRINRGGLRSLSELARIRTEAHRATHVSDVLLVFHQRDHGIVTFGRELTRMAVGQTDHIAGELDYRRLHSQADSKERQTRLPRVANRFEHSLDTSHSESSRDQHAVEIREKLARLLPVGEEIAREPRDLDPDIVRYSAVSERFLHALVGVDEAGVLADDGDFHSPLRMQHALHHVAPIG